MAGYENFYPGTYSSLEPTMYGNYGGGFMGYRIPLSDLGLTTDPRTNDLVKEVSSKLSHGGKVIEMTGIGGGGKEGGSPSTFLESIPRQHFKEVERLSKLTGAEVTMHAPIIEPSGISQGVFDESSRLEAENVLKMAIDRAHEMNSRGEVPVTVHSSTIPAVHWKKGLKGEKEMIYVVDTSTNQMQQAPVRKEGRYYPGEKEEQMHLPDDQIRIMNRTNWGNEITKILEKKRIADEMLRSDWDYLEKGGILQALNEKKIKKEQLTPELRQSYDRVQNAEIFYGQEILPEFNLIFHHAYKTYKETGDKENLEKLKAIGDEWSKKSEKVKSTPDEARLLNETLLEMGKLKAPKHFIPVEEFAEKHSAKTIANAALHGFMKFGNNAPTVSVENIMPDWAFSRADSLKKLVEESRKTFVEEAKKKGIGEGEARRAAEKFIGATWDVGHIHLMKKFGFDNKDIIEETKRIAPLVKHVHLSDNFGFEHTELPPGMGEVPMKEMLKELEKKGFSGKKILEVAQWWEHFKVSPLPYALEALGSPIYGMTAQPFWNQVGGVYGSYTQGPYAFMPEQHFSIYGTGFSSLPQELGGQIPGKQSRLTGTPTD